MSQRLPRITGKQLLRALKRLGFYEHTQKGSHLTLKHPVKSGRVVVPMHSGEIIKLGTLKYILQQADISIKELIENL
ncbi:type II toxin-antitoxin system HicA family toxin [candidate division WOR-3 bacterium]|nr:type II toxin-antitoxin system HicA family toxin [candidate division WOR-3 bacterium]